MPQGWSTQTHTSEAFSCHSLQREHLQSRSDKKGLHDVQTVMNQLVNGAGRGGGGGGGGGGGESWMNHGLRVQKRVQAGTHEAETQV